jgi:hypothetical protein
MQKLLWTFVMTCVFAGMGAVASTEAQAESKISFVRLPVESVGFEFPIRVVPARRCSDA